MIRTQHVCWAPSQALRIGATLVAGLFFITLPLMEAQTYTQLHVFAGRTSDGSFPRSNLVHDSAGNWYGTTQRGGVNDAGSIFKLDSTGTVTVLHSFNVADGLWPFAGLFRDSSGIMYGTTELGGTFNLGTVFSVDESGNLTTLHSFSNVEGFYPIAPLLRDAAGNLYGTTHQGGTSNLGTVFKLDTTGVLTILHSFNDDDGAYPAAGLVRDSSGNLFGTTTNGGGFTCSGFSCGTIFQLDPSGVLTILHSFNGADGAFPNGDLISRNGNFYGTCDQGGASNYGTVFQLDPSGTLTILHSFDKTDGAYPSAGLVVDAKGALYGVTYLGGSFSWGTVFKLNQATNAFKVLHSFVGFTDGQNPFANLALDANGNLFGTTQAGGGCSGQNHGCGTIFEIVLH